MDRKQIDEIHAELSRRMERIFPRMSDDELKKFHCDVSRVQARKIFSECVKKIDEADEEFLGAVCMFCSTLTQLSELSQNKQRGLESIGTEIKGMINIGKAMTVMSNEVSEVVDLWVADFIEEKLTELEIKHFPN